MEKLILKFLIINDNAELIEQRLKKILQENEQYSSIFDLQVKGIKGSEFDIDIRQEITFHHYDIIILGYSFITNEEYLSKHRFFEKIKSGEIVYKQKNPNWSVFDKDMLEIFYEKRTGIESIILKEDGSNLPPSEEQVEELDLKPINKYIPPEENGGNLHPKEEADRKAKEEADRKAQEAARKAKEEADRKAKEEARKAKEEADRKAKEEARKAKEEADRKAKEEARKAKEEADRKAQEVARKAKEEADRKAQEVARKAKEEADRKAQEEARKVQEEADNGGNLPPLEETGEFSEEEAKIFAIFQEEKNHKKEIPTKKIHQEKKEEEEQIKKDFSLTEEEILKILNPEKTVVETKISKPKEKPIIHEKRMAIDIDEEVGGNLPPTEENKTPEESETIEQETNSKKTGLGIKIPKFPKREKHGGKLPSMEETTLVEEQVKEDIEEPFYQEEEVLEEESSEKKKKGFTLPSFGLKHNSIKNGGKLLPREFKGDIGFFGNDRGVGTTFIAFTLAKVLSKNQTVAFIDMTKRTYKKLETLKEKNMIDFDVYNSSNFIDAYRKNTDIKIFDFGEIDLNSESYFAEFERCNLKFLVGAEDDLKIFSMNKNYHYNEKNPDFYTVINFKEETEERELQKEYQGLNIITIPFLQENIDDVLNLIR